MVERNFKFKFFRVSGRLGEVEPGRHIVPLVPVDLPPAAKRVPWPELKLDFVSVPDRVCCRNVANEVAHIHAFDVMRVDGLKLSEASLAAILHVHIVATKLTSYLGANILHQKMLVHLDIAPVRYFDLSCGLRHYNKRRLVVIHDTDQLGSVRSNIDFVTREGVAASRFRHVVGKLDDH